MKSLKKAVIGAAAALGLGAALSGCVYYPHGGGYYASGYYAPAPAVVVAPAPVVVGVGGCWHCGGWHHW